MDNVLNSLARQLSESIEGFIALFLSMQEDDEELFVETANVLRLLVDESNALQIVPRPNNFSRIHDYFEGVIPQYNNEEHHSHFRMTRETFQQLSHIIQSHLSAQDTVDERNNDDDEEEMPLEKKIYLTIWILSTPDSFRSVADRFGVSKSIAYNAYKEIVCILCTLMPRYIRWPDNHELPEIEYNFHRQSGFPGIVGAIDGCHIEMTQPPGNANDYYNRKGTHSIVLQGTCDHTGKFTDVLIGAPGRAHDSRILRSSSLYQKLTDLQNPLLPADKHLLGDSGYPLHINILTPFRDNGSLSPEHINYNIKHASARSVIERAFGRLKCKFRRLYRLEVKSVTSAILIVGASCMLHNFILLHDGIRRDSTLSNSSSSPTSNDEDELDEYSDDDDDVDVNLNAIQKRQQIMELLR